MEGVLITGGAGFIGSHLVDALMVRGEEVCVFDNLSTGSIENVRHWFGNPNFYDHKGRPIELNRSRETEI
jgi:UDP-glucose 4-epimerase